MGALVERCPEVAGVWRIADLAAATALGTHEARARVRAEDTGIDATRLDAVEEAATQFAGHRRTSR